jgi:hypothetical protein
MLGANIQFELDVMLRDGVGSLAGMQMPAHELAYSMRGLGGTGLCEFEVHE